MWLSNRESGPRLHGIVLGAGFLLAFTGGFAGLWFLRSQWLTKEGAAQCMRPIIVGAWTMAILAWLTVIVGTYVIYPWYRAKPPQPAAQMTTAELSGYPKFLLLSKPATADWHELGMEWKEHIGWFAPILATAVAYVVTRYGRQLVDDARIRRMLLFLYTAAFFCAAIAGLFGAFINKFAPTR